MSLALQDVITQLRSMSPEKLVKVNEEVMEATKDVLWVPSPGPQTAAFYSEADVLLYGGEPGGGKSSLLIGLAFTRHHRSLIMRRQYTDLGHIIEEVLRFNGGKQGWNGSPPPSLKRPDGKVIDLGAASKVGDEQHWQGNPHDFIGFDEGTQFAKQQVDFLMGWLRSVSPGQRKRCVIATNPPLEAEGLWVTEMFAPWLDDKHINPALDGELRYAIMGDDDKLIWVAGPDPVRYAGRDIEPKSYTFISASLADNPFLADTGYQKNLDGMAESIRSILMGGFKTTFRDAPNQLIPTEWIRLAQLKWRDAAPDGVPMCTMGVDCTGGGADPVVIAPRYDGWFQRLIEIPAKEIETNRVTSTTVSSIITHRRDKALVIIDVGGGYGTGPLEMLEENEIEVMAYKGAEASARRSRDGKLKFTNTRTAALWMFREALDPEQAGGSPIRLPPGNKLLADLAAPTYSPTPNGIKAESKEDVCKRLGRSTNDGDAVMMAWFYGAKESNSALDWIEKKHQHKRGQAPKVIIGRKLRTARKN